MNRSRAAVLWLVEQILPLPKCLFDEWTIRRKMAKGSNAPLGTDEVYLALGMPDLKDSHRAALGLREQLQRRAQGYLMAVTVATSFALGSLGLLAKVQGGSVDAVHLSSTTRWTLLFVLASFFMSATSSLRVLGPSQAYDLWLRSHMPNDEDSKKANIIRFIQLNEAYAMIYSYQTRCSYIGMRNGVFALFVWFAVMILQPRRLL